MSTSKSNFVQSVEKNGLMNTCIVYIIVYGLAWWLSSYLFSYTIYAWTDKAIPWYASMLGGLFCAGITVPAAVVTWVLQLCGVI